MCDEEGECSELAIKCQYCGELFPEDEVYVSEAGPLFCSQQCAEDFELRRTR